MKWLAALLSIFAVAWLALRLRPVRPQRAWGIERGAAVRIGWRFVAVRIQIGGVV